MQEKTRKDTTIIIIRNKIKQYRQSRAILLLLLRVDKKTRNGNEREVMGHSSAVSHPIEAASSIIIIIIITKQDTEDKNRTRKDKIKDKVDKNRTRKMKQDKNKTSK